MNKHLRQKHLQRTSTCFYLFFICCILLNPELFPTFLHEYLFHKSGAEIDHIHTDLTFHSFFRHSSESSANDAVKTLKKKLLVNILVFHARYVVAETVHMAVFLFLLSVIILLTLKLFTTRLLPTRARSPPLI
jgi:hypothetical protein